MVPRIIEGSFRASIFPTRRKEESCQLSSQVGRWVQEEPRQTTLLDIGKVEEITVPQDLCVENLQGGINNLQEKGDTAGNSWVRRANGLYFGV